MTPTIAEVKSVVDCLRPPQAGGRCGEPGLASAAGALRNCDYYILVDAARTSDIENHQTTRESPPPAPAPPLESLPKICGVKIPPQDSTANQRSATADTAHTTLKNPELPPTWVRSTVRSRVPVRSSRRLPRYDTPKHRTVHPEPLIRRSPPNQEQSPFNQTADVRSTKLR